MQLRIDNCQNNIKHISCVVFLYWRWYCKILQTKSPIIQSLNKLQFFKVANTVHTFRPFLGSCRRSWHHECENNTPPSEACWPILQSRLCLPSVVYHSVDKTKLVTRGTDVMKVVSIKNVEKWILCQKKKNVLHEYNNKSSLILGLNIIKKLKNP